MTPIATSSFLAAWTAVWLVLTLSASPVEAAEHDQHHPIGAGEKGDAVTLEQALELAARRAPELGSARAAEAGAAELARSNRGLVSRPPELTVTAGPRFGSATTGVDASATLLQPLSLGGVGGARGRLAAARREAARAGLEDARARAALAGGAAWVEARVAEELMRVRSESLREAGVLDTLAEARLASGAATAGERAFARSLLGTARAALLEAEGRKFAAGAELAFQSGSSAEQLEATGPLEVDGPAITETEALARAARHPRLAHLEAEASAFTRSVEQARAEGGPVLSIGPSLTREGTGDIILLGHVSVPLPFVNPNEFEAADRSRHALVAKADVVRERQRLRVDIRVALHERLHARLMRDALLKDAVGPGRAALDEATLRYSEGKAQLGEVLTARRALIEVEERCIAAAGAARLAELRLLSALGRLVPESK